MKRDLAEARLAAYGLSLGMHHNLSVGVGGEVDAPHAGVGFERAHARLEGTHALGQVPYLGASQAPAVAANPLSDTTTIPALRVMTKPSTSVGATEGYASLPTQTSW